ncbi:hypothetical protein [Rhodococcus jostii]|uniref:hypothetical protein n=1 Tax=Rhodococcus jostii TaxID=132919 RepID=UPI0036343AB0
MTENREVSLLRGAGLCGMMHTLLVVGVIAGSVCAGSETGSATTTTAAEAVIGSTNTASDSQHELDDEADTWYLQNYTGKRVYGQWSLHAGSEHSDINTTLEGALQDGERIDENYNFPWYGSTRRYVMGHLCFNHMYRNANNLDVDIAGDRGFTLVVTPGSNPPGLSVKWEDTHFKNHEAPLVDNLAEPRC